MIAIIDYDAGNLKSVEKALLYLGQDVLVTRDREKILSADKVILPGVGNFGDAMEKLEGFGWRKSSGKRRGRESPSWESAWGFSCSLSEALRRLVWKDLEF